MSYQQAQHRPPPQRTIPAIVTSAAEQSSRLLQPVAASPEEWILFSPKSVASQAATSQTPQTTNLSYISDFGSFNTGLASDRAEDQIQDPDDEEAELDSLDDGLHAFHAPIFPRLDHSGSILPADRPYPTLDAHADPDVHGQLWQHERYNPDKITDIPRATEVQDEQRQRIEQWRLEQSRAVVEEIEREARRHQRRDARRSSLTKSASANPAKRGLDESIEVLVDSQCSESFWDRITRRVIHDLIGLDEGTLTLIFGENFMHHVEEAETRDQRPSAPSSGSWERRLLSRIAHELGILVDQISSESSRAFSTYHEVSLDGQENKQAQTIERRTSRPAARRASNGEPVFKPTLSPIMTPLAANQTLWGIEEEPCGADTDVDADAAASQTDRDYWQRDPSIRMIFGYLVNRFSSRPCSPTRYSTHPAPIISDEAGPLPASWANTTQSNEADSAPRAELIRRNHPLVSQSTQRRRESLLRRHLHHHQQSLLLQGSPIHHRRVAGSSCASQSTNKRSRRSASVGTGLSRNFWDFPSGATGAGSEVSVASGPMSGNWGDV